MKVLLLHSLFNKNAGVQAAILSKKTLWYRCFPVNFAKLFRTAFFIDHLWSMHLVHVLGVAKCIDVSLGPKPASILYK